MTLEPEQNPMTAAIDFPHFSELGKKALEMLPTETKYAVADYLAGHGVQAVCGSPEKCAIAEHLIAHAPLPEGYTWAVDGTDAEITYDIRYWEQADVVYMHLRDYNRVAGLHHVELPNAVREFVPAFDRQEFPELIANDDPGKE